MSYMKLVAHTLNTLIQLKPEIEKLAKNNELWKDLHESVNELHLPKPAPTITIRMNDTSNRILWD